MEAKVIAFNPKARQPKQEEPFNLSDSGDAFCLQCGNSFEAKFEPGQSYVYCPACNSHKAVLRGTFLPPPGTKIRKCDCGNMHFLLTDVGHLCPVCGNYQRY